MTYFMASSILSQVHHAFQELHDFTGASDFLVHQVGSKAMTLHEFPTKLAYFLQFSWRHQRMNIALPTTKELESASWQQ